MFNFRFTRLAAGAAVLALAAACTDEAPPTAVDGPSAVSSAQYISPGDGNETGASPGVAEEELFEVCKRWVGTSGVAIFDVDDGSGTIFTGMNGSNRHNLVLRISMLSRIWRTDYGPLQVKRCMPNASLR